MLVEWYDGTKLTRTEEMTQAEINRLIINRRYIAACALRGKQYDVAIYATLDDKGVYRFADPVMLMSRNKMERKTIHSSVKIFCVSHKTA